MRRQVRAVVVAVLVLALVGGCSSDDGGDDASASSSTGSVPTSSAGPIRPERTVTEEPAAEVTGPIEGGARGVPYNPMPPGLAEERGYVEEEFFVEGDATAYEADGELGPDGEWSVTEGAAATYRTRVLVRRPTDPGAFSGVVAVEWLNVSAGRDSDADFGFLHPLLLGEGDIYVGVSAQEVGVVGGGGLDIPGVPEEALAPLVEWDPERYGDLDHPGDAYSYDIFSTVGELVRAAGPTDLLGGLEPTTVIGVGESQSASRMLSYVDAVQPVAGVYDGFLIHSRGDTGADLGDGSEVVGPTQVRTDLDVPVLQVQTETDLFGVIGSYPARQPDTDTVVTWELAGTAHADASTLDYGVASGSVWSDTEVDFSDECGTVNQAHQAQVVQAAFAALVTWVRDDEVPPSAEPIEVADGAIVRDELGNALGGIRLPDVEAPIAVSTGVTDAESIFCVLFGQTTPFDDARLAQLYPTAADYVTEVTDAADALVAEGFLLPSGAEEIVADAEAVDLPT